MRSIFKSAFAGIALAIVLTMAFMLVIWAFPKHNLDETFLAWPLVPGMMTGWWLIGFDNYSGPGWWATCVFIAATFVINGTIGFMLGALIGLCRYMPPPLKASHCRRCGYDLRGHALTGVFKCPECGYENRTCICRGRSERMRKESATLAQQINASANCCTEGDGTTSGVERSDQEADTAEANHPLIMHCRGRADRLARPRSE